SDRLSNQEAIIFLAIDDNNKAVGLVLNYVSFSTLSQGKIVILNDLFVDSAYRNRRIGRELIERTFEFAKSINAVRVDISTSNKNTGAQKLYESIGFEREDESCHFSHPLK